MGKKKDLLQAQQQRDDYLKRQTTEMKAWLTGLKFFGGFLAAGAALGAITIRLLGG